MGRYTCAAPRVFSDALEHRQEVGGKHGGCVVEQFVIRCQIKTLRANGGKLRAQHCAGSGAAF
jgi:hypothetical protein